MSAEATIAIVTAMGVLFTALAGALVTIMNALHKNSTERAVREAQEAARREKDALDEYKALVARQEQHIARLQLHNEQQQEFINKLQAELAECQVMLAEVQGDAWHLYEACLRHAAALRKAQLDPGEDPPAPRKPRRTGSEAEHGQRTTQQNTRLAGATDPKIVPPVDTPEP